MNTDIFMNYPRFLNIINKVTHLKLATVFAIFSLALTGTVHADEGGVPFWFSGQFASLAAVPITPGWSLPSMFYNYNAKAATGEKIIKSGDITLGLKTRTSLFLVQPTYAPETKLFNGQVALALGMGYGKNNTSASINIIPVNSPDNINLNQSHQVWGFSDLYPIVSVAWNSSVHNWMTYITGDIPTGAYNYARLANLGIGHGAIDVGAAYTYFNQISGKEFSAVLGFTYNLKNHATNYQNGIDAHLDWAASQFFATNWQIGVVGYIYNQLTGDQGSGALLNSFKSRIAAIGPEIAYIFKLGKKEAYLNLRGYYEFWAQHRVKGESLFLMLVIPI